MKKIFVLALALIFVLSGAVMGYDYKGVFVDDPYDFENEDTIWSEYYIVDGSETNPKYDDHVGDDGIYTDNDTGADYSNLSKIDNQLITSSVELDSTPGLEDQKVSVKLLVDAYIPCFIEMRVTGNRGTASAISYTHTEAAYEGDAGWRIVFDNEIGGFLDEDWKTLGHGQHAEVNPESNVYIGACDYFAVEVISNASYRYEVESDALTHDSVANTKLNMEMQTSLDGGSSWPQFVLFDSNKTRTIGERNAGVKLEAVHRFRVPYQMSTTTGHYDGDITFRAYTL